MMKTQIKAEIVADSINQQGDRLTSLLITFPRIILAEVNTHRMLSKNTSSSRAIPFKKMVESVQNDPFIPIAWQKDHKGMQGTEYENRDWRIAQIKDEWLAARDNAIESATELNKGVTKQLCNRLLEPFMWTTMLITGSEEGWDNFFELRCPQYELKQQINNEPEKTFYFKSKKDYKKFFKEGFDNDPRYFHLVDSMSDLEWLQINKGQAEIHIMDLAEKIYDVMNESGPNQLEAGEWHIPMIEVIED